MTRPITASARARRTLLSSLPLAALLLFGASLLAAGAVRAEELESDAVYLPAGGARTLTVRNMLGTVRVQGWDRAEVRIVAHKRAGSPSLLQRLRVRADYGDGRVRVTTGFYYSDGTFNPLPLAGSAIDLEIDAPRAVELAVATFHGDVDASGFRAGAKLSSEKGHIRVADLEGVVDTRAFDGNQAFEAIRGSLAARGIVGDLELDDIRGPLVDAVAFRGRITARDVDAQLVRLHTTIGTVVFVGGLRPGGRYDLAARDGDVRMELPSGASFVLTARAPSVQSGFTLRETAPRVWRPVALAPPRPLGEEPAHLDLVSQRGAALLLRRD